MRIVLFFMNQLKNYSSILLILLIGTLLVLPQSGCAPRAGETAWQTVKRNMDEDVGFELGGSHLFTYYSDKRVTVSRPVVQVFPVNAGGNIKVLFVPLRVTQRMDSPELVGYSTGRIIWQIWASMQIFDTMEYASDSGPFNIRTAIPLARLKGADMVIGGYVTHILNGGTVGQSSVAIQIEAYDVKNGNLVWSIAQSGLISRPQSTDLVLVNKEQRMPQDPVYAITATMASQIGELLLNWNRGEGADREELPKNPGGNAIY